MGVRGLTTFVEVNEEALCEVYYLHDCKIVLDGLSLMCWLLDCTDQPPSSLGGEHTNFTKIVVEFFNGLYQCQIKPYVVFDGPSADAKSDKILQRYQENVAAIDEIFHSDDPDVKQGAMPTPPNVTDAFIQLLIELGVPFAFSLVDADSELTAVANSLNCPLLATDSDYYIYDLKCGYISLHDVPLGVKEGQTKLKCRRYMSSVFCSKYGVTQSKLPFLSIILGNDWVPTEVFGNKVFGIARHFKVDRRDYTWRVKTALIWLSMRDVRSDEAILGELYASMPMLDKNEIITKIHYSLSVYRDPPDISMLREILVENSLREVSVEGCFPKPSSIEGALREGYLCVLAYCLIKENCAPLSLISCDTRRHSPHLCAVKIRSFAYSHLLRKFCLDSEGAQVIHVGENDINELAYNQARVLRIYTSRCLLCEKRHHFNECCEDGISLDVHTVISKLLKVEFKQPFDALCSSELSDLIQKASGNFGVRLNLVMLSTFYWIRQTSPSVSALAALLLTLTFFVEECISGKREYLLPECKESIDASSTRLSVTVSNKEIPVSSMCSKESKGQEGKKEEPTGILLMPAWYKQKLMKNKLTELQGAAAKKTENSTPEDLENQSKITPKSALKFVNLFGPRSPIFSKKVNLFWWIFQEQFSPNMELVHSIAEWHCTNLAILLLHRSIEYDGIRLGTQDFLGSNLLLHEIHTRLTSSGSNKMAEFDCGDRKSYLYDMALLLDDNPLRKSLYEAMVKYLDV